MRIFRRQRTDVERQWYDFAPGTTPEQLSAILPRLHELMSQLEARQAIAQKEHEEAQREHIRTWFRSFGVEVVI